MTAIQATEQKLGLSFPAYLKAFLARGIRSATGAVKHPFASIGFDFLDCSALLKHTLILRKTAEGLDEDDDHAELIYRGVVVTADEPELVVTADGVWHFSYRNPLLRVAPNWSAFLLHWLASGCFCSHSYTSLWKAVGPYVPGKLQPAKNTWLQAYKKQLPSFA